VPVEGLSFQHNKPMENNESREELISKGVMGLLLGLALMVAGIFVGRQLHIVWNIWPSTDAVVVRGTVQEVVDVPIAKGGGPYYNYVPQIEFSYTVGGRKYTTSAPSVYSTDSFDQAAANLKGLYARGTHHPIRYNPRNPGEIQFGVIEFGPLAFAFLLLVLGGVVLAIGIRALGKGIAQSPARVPTEQQRVGATVLPFAARTRPEASAATVNCPSCGRQVRVTEDSCPNCLKSLRAA
jgi:F0F1-type ATP synthase membrane subunit c/vacuolar-type H+-ATPase subunit K